MKQKTIKILYWIFTILFAGFMLFSASAELMNGASAQQVLIMLGYPTYLNYILGVAKLLGAITILTPKFKTLKEWAYAGFTIDLLGAGTSYILSGNGFVSFLFLLPFLAILFLSYIFWKKMQNK